MNKFIKQELDKLSKNDYNQIDDNHYVFSKQDITAVQFELNKSYLIELADYLIHPSPTFTLAANWNKGVDPKSKYMKVYINQRMGKMLQIDGRGLILDEDGNYQDSYDIYFNFWLPEGAIKLIKNL